MQKLPEEFLARMRHQLGEEYEAFLSCYNSDGYAGLRVNTGKISVQEFLALTPFTLIPVPWTENGFYYRKEDAVTKHPHYYAGLYYVQEPSAMLPAAKLPVDRGNLVLDLCAAPGGKATELSSRLKGTGMLIANDASASRAKALVKNLSIWGSSNCCITGETPRKLLEQFGCTFDRILVDAPCSGEGMFRKDSRLIDSWMERGPETYAPIQKDILQTAVEMLRPDGMLVYSTCTFSKEEDEEVIQMILSENPSLELIEPGHMEGFAKGEAPLENCIRLWPHKVRGEGHFMALLHKKNIKNIAGISTYSEKELEKSHKKMPEEVQSFINMIPSELWKNKKYEQIGEQCLFLPPWKLPSHIRFLRTGILAGTTKKGRFEPDQALAMLLTKEMFPIVLNLSSEDERVFRYLKGETIDLLDEEETLAKGWVLICTDGFGLGWGKTSGRSIKNKLYPGWRIQ